MTLNEITYMCLEILRAGHIVDDERLDNRLIKDWINLKREQYISNSLTKNPSNRINLSLYQTESIETTVSTVTDVGDYPYSDDTVQVYKIVTSGTVPSIIEGVTGPLIYAIETEDIMKLPISVVEFGRLRVAGSGKFNSGILYGAYRENKIYFKYNTFFDTYSDFKLKAVFANPREVTGFDDDVTPYPANLKLIEYIKNGILDVDIRAFLSSRADEVNNADGEV